MKYVKRVLSIVFAVMLVLSVDGTVTNAASIDPDAPTVITLHAGSTMYGHAAGFFNENEMIHYYKFTLGTTSLYPDTMAVYLTVPTGCNYQMQIVDMNSGQTYEGFGKGGTSDKVIKIPKPRTTSTYLLQVFSEDGFYDTSLSGMYSISIDNLYKKGTYTGKFNPTKLTNPGQATLTPVYSGTATVDLRRNTTIPDTAEVTDVEVSGTLSYNIGNTWLEIDNSVSGSHNEARLNKGYDTSFPGLSDSYEPVKAVWSIEYYTYAGKSTTFSNPQITIDYRYDQYEDFS